MEIICNTCTNDCPTIGKGSNRKKLYYATPIYGPCHRYEAPKPLKATVLENLIHSCPQEVSELLSSHDLTIVNSRQKPYFDLV